MNPSVNRTVVKVSLKQGTGLKCGPSGCENQGSHNLT